MPPSAREFLPALCLLLVIALWIFGCGDAELKLDPLPSCPTQDPPIFCITINDVNPNNLEAHFDPMEIRVSAGTAVLWSYNGFDIHELEFNSVNPQTGEITSRPDLGCPTFTLTSHCSKMLDTGTYQFSCSLHPFTAAGTLVVENQ